MALTAEVGELNELFQWLSEDASRAVARDAATARRVRDELADVLIYGLSFANSSGIDVSDAIFRSPPTR